MVLNSYNPPKGSAVRYACYAQLATTAMSFAAGFLHGKEGQHFYFADIREFLGGAPKTTLESLEQAIAPHLISVSVGLGGLTGGITGVCTGIQHAVTKQKVAGGIAGVVSGAALGAFINGAFYVIGMYVGVHMHSNQ